MQKILTVATEVQKIVFENVLLHEITSGFWKNARPSDHTDYWKGVTITLGSNLGISGFECPRNYNFVNPDFFKKNEEKLLEAARVINKNITVKQLKKQLISLNQILGSRLKELGGDVTKLQRGKKNSTEITMKEKKLANVTVRKVAAKIVESEEQEA